MKRHVESIEHVAGVEVVGLVVSQAHDSYEMFVRDAAASQSAKVEGPFFLLCDRVAKSVEGPDFRPFTSVQHSNKRKIDDVM